MINQNESAIRLASELQFDSIVDGPGLRTVIWTQGCIHNCKGCHNPQTHSFTGGFMFPIQDIITQLQSVDQNVTFSGGDPMLQPKQCLAIAKEIKRLGRNIWVYTGFTFEYLLNSSEHRAFLECIDVLVDGKFDEKEKTSECKFRGSKNQRLIDVQKSLKSNSIVLWEDEMDRFQRRSFELI